MLKYHNHPVNGPTKCRVGEGKTVRGCPFGDLETEHYTSKEEAQAAFEKTFENLFVSTVTTNSRAREVIVEKLGPLLEAVSEDAPVRDWSAAEAPVIARLGDLRNGKVAANKCDFAAFTVNEEIDHKLATLGLSLEPIAVGFSGVEQSHHTALKIIDEKGIFVVLDYSARQFDERAEFPLVASPRDWHSFVNEKASEIFGIEIVGYHEEGYSSQRLVSLEDLPEIQE